MVILGSIIHERYIHVGNQQGDEQTIRLDVISDRGRWIVKFSEFMDVLQSYVLSRDEIAVVVCDMIDNYRKLVEKDDPKYRTIPPTIGNYDLDWLLGEYASRELELKRKFMSEVFNVSEVPDQILTKLRFFANQIGYKKFVLFVTPHHGSGQNSDSKRAVSWTRLSEIVRSHFNNAWVRTQM